MMCFLLLMTLSPSSMPVEAWVFGRKITDPSGDADPTYDIIEVSIKEGHYIIHYKVSGSIGSIGAYSVLFDIDRNPATGEQGWWTGIGPEFWISYLGEDQEAWLFTIGWVKVKQLWYSVEGGYLKISDFTLSDMGLSGRINRIDIAAYSYTKSSGPMDRAPDTGVRTITIISPP